MYRRLHVALVTDPIAKGVYMSISSVELSEVHVGIDPDFIFQQQAAMLTMRMERAARAQIFTGWLKTGAIWWSKLNQSVLPVRILKVAPLGISVCLLPIAFFASYASVVLVVKGDVSGSFSSNESRRLDSSNLLTNSGAIFACLTDFPAIVYGAYLLSLRSAHCQAQRQDLEKLYTAIVEEDGVVLANPVREYIYQKYCLYTNIS